MRTATRLGLVVTSLVHVGLAWAQGASLPSESTSPPADEIVRMLEGRLISAPHAAGYSLPGGPLDGLLLGVDLGLADPVATGGGEGSASMAVGARIGWQSRVGLSVSLQYQDLGLSPTLVDQTQWQLAGLGVRYAFVSLPVIPYVEAMGGFSFVGGATGTAVGPGGAVGLGLTFPFGRHLALDVGARDWLAPVTGSLLQVLTVQAGVDFVLGDSGVSRMSH